MSKYNAYLEKIQAIKQTYFEVGSEKATQQFFDYMCIALNDPEAMGKDVFGKKRIKRLHEAMAKVDELYTDAWSGSKEADYLQEKLDAKLREIFGVIVPFKERYPYMKDWDYNKPCKK